MYVGTCLSRLSHKRFNQAQLSVFQPDPIKSSILLLGQSDVNGLVAVYTQLPLGQIRKKIHSPRSDQIRGQTGVNGQLILLSFYIRLPIEENRQCPCLLCIIGADMDLSSDCSTQPSRGSVDGSPAEQNQIRSFEKWIGSDWIFLSAGKTLLWLIHFK